MSYVKKKRNPVHREMVSSTRHHERKIGDKRRHIKNKLNEEEADDDLLHFENPDTFEFYWEDFPVDENGELIFG